MLFASTAPAASTGASHGFTAVVRLRPPPVAARSGTPRRRGATDDPHTAARLARAGGAGARRTRRRGRGAASRCRGPPSSVQRITRSRYRISSCPSTSSQTMTVLRAGGRPLCRSSCKQPIVVAHDPVVRDRARLLEAKHLVQAHAPRHAPRGSRRPRPAACAKRRLWSAQYSVSRNAFAAATSAMPFRRVSSPADPDASRGCARCAPWPAASSPG